VKRYCHQVEVIPSEARNLVEIKIRIPRLSPRNDRERFSRRSAMNLTFLVRYFELQFLVLLEQIGDHNSAMRALKISCILSFLPAC
jgi:hypothetical protein